MTCDRHVEMLRTDGAAAYLDPDHILIESKSEGGTGDWDDALKAEGIEPVSLSKYRVGPLAAGRAGPRGAAAALGRGSSSPSPGEAVVVEVEAGAAPGRLEGRRGAERRVAVAVEVVAVGRPAAAAEEDLVLAPAQHRLEVAPVGLAA